MTIKCIVAMDTKGGIGKDNSIPWHGLESVAYDLARFKLFTTNHICIMGRRTWDSLPKKPLKGRSNWIVAKKELGVVHTENESVTEVRVFDSPFVALGAAMIRQMETKQDIWIIGGASIYSQLLHTVDELHVTKIRGDFNCDTFFPEYKNEFKITEYEIGPDPLIEYVTYRRVLT